MKTYHDCLSCFVKQALGALRRSGATDKDIDRVMREVFLDLARVDYCLPPPVMATRIHQKVVQATGVSDPLRDEKKQFNRFALSVLDDLLNCSRTYTFEEKVKLAIAANIIDFGKNTELTEREVEKCFENALQTPVDSHAVSLLEQTLNSASRILFLCDNAGEIVFDRFLMESMPLERIICAVRGKPVINDATMEDARETGMTDSVKVISNGSDVPGTFLKSCSPGFREIFEKADLVIAKGQGNFETLSEVKQKKIFFLLQVKCPVISRDVGFPVGTFLIKSSGDQENRFVCNENHLTQKEVYHG